MERYSPIYEKPYPDGWENLPSEETPVTGEVMEGYDEVVDNIENYLSQNPIPESAADIKVNPLMTQQDFNDQIIEQLRTFDMYYVSNEAFEPVQEKVEELDPVVSELNKSFTQYEQSGFLSRNLLDMSDLASWYAQDTVWQRKLVKVKANTSYTVSTDTNNGSLAMCLFGASDDITTTLTTSANGVFKESPRTVTSTSNGNVLILINKNFPNAKVQLEEGKETTYTPYAPSNTELKKSFQQLATTKKYTSDAIVTTHTIETSTTHAEKNGNIVTLTVRLKTTSSVAGFAILATLNSELKPLANVWTSGFNGGNFAMFSIDKNGTIVCSVNIPSDATIIFGITYSI